MTELSTTTTGAELAEFIYCCRWMSPSLPNFNSVIKPLQGLLEACFNKSGRRTKRNIRHIALCDISRGTTYVEALNAIQYMLRNAVRLSFHKPDHIVCVYTDASNNLWPVVVTQSPPTELFEPRCDQRHESLAFLGSSFKDAELGWATFEKEAFAIYKVFEKLDYIFYASTTTRVFTDHRGLLFVFAPLSGEPRLGRHIVNNVQRWALYLSHFQYSLEHVDGSENVFADTLTQWLRGYRGRSQYGTACSLLLESTQQLISG